MVRLLAPSRAAGHSHRLVGVLRTSLAEFVDPAGNEEGLSQFSLFHSFHRCFAGFLLVVVSGHRIFFCIYACLFLYRA